MNEATPVSEKNEKAEPKKAAEPQKPPARAIPPSLAVKLKHESVPVRLVLFSRPQSIPGDESATRIKCEPQKPGEVRKHWTANYIPALASIEVFYFPPNQNEPVRHAFMAFSDVSMWEPV